MQNPDTRPLTRARAQRSLGRYAPLPVLFMMLAGCGASLNMENLREAVREGLEAQLGLPISRVDCPESRPVMEGDRFECTAAAEGGGRLVVQVTQDDDAGNVSWEVVRSEGLLDLEALEEQIKTGLMEQAAIDAAVDCGGTYRAALPGETFDCALRDDEGREGTVTVTTEDATGNVSWVLN